MNDVEYNKKVELSNKIYPIFSGISGDLLFWIAIDTIFLTVVKGFNAAQISSLSTIGNLITILIYPIAFKIIKKIGNIRSIKLGTVLLLCSAILLTFANKYLIILLGHILYDSAFLFKNMDNVILRKNLKYANKEKDYIKIQNKSSFIYSLITMLIAFTVGFLFNINNYLPMILCISFCILSVILSNFLYEYKNNKNDEFKEKQKLSITKLIFLILLLYASLYATIDLGQANSKLLIQYKLSSFLEISKVSIYLSIIIAISRIVRVISDYFFTKHFKGKNKQVLYVIGYTLIGTFISIIFGSMLKLRIIGIVLMSLGFFVFFGIRDLFANYIKTLLLNSCSEKYHEQAITYLTLSRKVGKFLIGGAITLILLKFDLIYVIIFLLIISILNILIIKRICNLLKNKEEQ